ncbi:acetyltransferase [Pseudomonas protegens]|jgi:sugar O-acyltransferase (sialic acid O-acetyltransferase NeuD family)|uniref:Acetyltransferase n=1 Tax=Pseudomonas sp. W17 TaxID=3144407 RepID=A0AAU7WZZ4_9PSED|nr:acetyltransferase [Pseudomonas protegens]WRV93347.1 acetyltransferase [Pseudomonas protegens]BAO61060.1 transferase [Pseudomonas protegens Cab57]
MKQVIILGAGGLGRQVLAQVEADVACGVDWVIGGFLDERGSEVVSKAFDCPWLGTPECFQPESEHLFLVAIGDPSSRQRQVQLLFEKGARFIDFGKPQRLGVRTEWGTTFFSYNVSCGVDSKIGNHCFIDQDSMIGHDVVIGDYVHIAPRCLLAGYVKVGNGVVINSGAMLSRGVTVGDGAVIGMGAVVFKDVPAGATVVGNPARVIFTKQS